MMGTCRKGREDTKVTKSSEVGADHSPRLNEAEFSDAYPAVVYTGTIIVSL